MTELLRVAVCGTGNAGLEHLRAFAASPGAEVTAIVELDAERGRAARDELGLTCPVLPALAAALEEAPIDAVVVATPNDLHATTTVEAARAGKHVLLEKPAAVSRDDLDRMDAEVRAAGVQCQVNMILRWHPMVEAIVAARDRGELGEIFCVEAEFVFGELEGAEPDWARTVARGGSLHLYAGCHAYDQLEWLAASRVEEIAVVSTRRSDRWEYDATACAAVRFASGAIGRATITLEAAAPYRFGIRVFGTRGTVVDDTMVVPSGGEARATRLSGRPIDVDYLPFDRVANDFVANVRAGTESHASLARTVDVFRLALDAERAAHERTVVVRGRSRG